MSGLCAFQNTTTAENSGGRYQYPEPEQQAYLNACRQVSKEQGFTQQQAESLCKCTLEQFKTQYTVDQFRELYTEASQNNNIPTEFLKAGMLCADQLSLN